jgi:hypothetical protein
MLFAAIYTARNWTEESQKRSLALFTNWQPPFEFKANYSRSDGRGGIAIIESDDAAAVLEGVSTFTPYFDFEVTPIVDIETAVPVFSRVNEWRDSVG